MILAIDPGNNLGYCIGKSNGNIISSGVYFLKKPSEKNNSKRLLNLLEWLHEINKQYKIEYICIEAARNMRNYTGMLSVAEICAVIKLFSAMNNIECKEYSAKSIKKYITGSGNANKQDMIDSIKQKYNLKIINDNEADAIGIFKFSIKDKN